ncbi:hypothetical protein BKA70DRAFT_1293894 [Coprinopsis sp. MPI-PUGE-AT-0042]|nr:hypothetical protein BKA70DRAFT_1293894 [Coprinopsis sp. MPI-PUGE-AT-0042]
MALHLLPQELWEAILDNAAADDLLNLSLTSKGFRESSQKRIFNAISLRRSTKDLAATWDLFTRSVSTSIRLAAEVRSVHVDLTWNLTQRAEFIATSLLLVVDFSGTPVNFGALPSRQCHIYQSSKFPSIHTIRLSNIANFPLLFLLPFPNLKSLSLFNVNFSSGAHSLELEVPEEEDEEGSLERPSISLPETLVLVPTSFWELFLVFEAAEFNAKRGGQLKLDVSKLRNLFLEFPWDITRSFPPGALQHVQFALKVASQQLECLEIFLDNTAAFCEDPASKAIRYANLKRLSFIIELVQEDMLRGVNSVAYAALASVVNWIKAVDAGEHLEEFHLCPRFMFDGNEADIDQRRLIEQVILPALLELQAYLTRDKHRVPPRVKISVNCAREEDLEPIRVRLARLEASGLDVNGIEQSLCSSNILGNRTILID